MNNISDNRLNWKERLDCWGNSMFKHKDLDIWIVSKNKDRSIFEVQPSKNIRDKFKKFQFDNLDSAFQYTENILIS